MHHPRRVERHRPGAQPVAEAARSGPARSAASAARRARRTAGARGRPGPRPGRRAPARFSGSTVSTPSRSCPTQAARPPDRVNASSSARSASLAAVLSDRLPTSTTARARWARISATYSRSASSCAAVLVMHTSSPPASGDLDEPGRDRGEVRVGDVAQGHADHRALAGRHRPGLQVGRVAEVGDRLVHPVGERLADPARAVVHHPGRGGQRHPGPVGDILQRHPLGARRGRRVRPPGRTVVAHRAAPDPVRLTAVLPSLFSGKPFPKRIRPHTRKAGRWRARSFRSP